MTTNSNGKHGKRKRQAKLLRLRLLNREKGYVKNPHCGSAKKSIVTANINYRWFLVSGHGHGKDHSGARAAQAA